MHDAEKGNVVHAGMLIGSPKDVKDGGSYAVVPNDSKIIDLTEYLVRPVYPKANIAARTADALIEYVNGHKTTATAIFADAERCVITGVIDYHKDNTAGHSAHRVIYTAPVSEEWRTWTEADGRKMQQADFARFIEENRIDVVDPDGASILEVAKSLDARKKVSFKSGIRLDDGTVDLSYSEETTASGGGVGGKISIPSEIKLGIPVFYGGDRYSITAFFRYRIEEGRLMMWIDLHRKKHIRDHAFREIGLKVKVSCEGVPNYEAAI